MELSNAILIEHWTFRDGVHFSFNLLLLITALWLTVLLCRSLVVWRRRECPVEVARRLGVMGLLFGLAKTIYALRYAFTLRYAAQQDFSFLDSHPDIRMMMALQCFDYLAPLYYGILMLTAGLLASYLFEFLNRRRSAMKIKDQSGATSPPM